MKVLRIVLFIVLALAGIFILMGLIGPKTYKVERSTVITATPDAVWPYVSNLKKANEWSPFVQQDTAMVIEYTGNDGEIGSMSKWESKKMGKGQQEIIALEPAKTVNTQLTFFMPWGSSKSDAYFHLEPDATGTKVVWGMSGNNNFMGRAFGVMMNMDKMVGTEYEKGLSNLKTMVESLSGTTQNEYAPASPDGVGMGDYPGGTYIAVRSKIKMDDMKSFFEKSFGTIMEGIQKNGITPTSASLGIYYMWDMEKGDTDVAAAIGVPAGTKAPAGTELITLSPSKSVSVKHAGGYHGLYAAHMNIDAYLKANNLEQVPPVLEEYVVDMMTQPDTNKLLTVITYLVK